MNIKISTGLIEAIVLAACEKHPDYGYNITQNVRKKTKISESTLYPVLRRLAIDKCLTSFTEKHCGRQRKYYQITENGKKRLAEYREAWKIYREQIDSALN